LDDGDTLLFKSILTTRASVLLACEKDDARTTVKLFDEEKPSSDWEEGLKLLRKATGEPEPEPEPEGSAQ
jgi:hypothetical protein